MVLNLTKYFNDTTVVIVLMSAIDKWWMHYGYATINFDDEKSEDEKNDVT